MEKKYKALFKQTRLFSALLLLLIFTKVVIAISLKISEKYMLAALEIASIGDLKGFDDSLLGSDNPLLFRVFSERFKYILTKAQNWNKEDIGGYMRTLTTRERILFSASYLASKDYQNWRNQKSKQIQQSEIIRSRKRKIAPN